MRIATYTLALLLMISCKSKQLAVVKLDGKFGCIDRKGNLKIEPIWDYILLDEKDKPNLVRKDSLYGYVNRKGKILIQPQFKEAELFSEGLAAVYNGEKFGFINTNGELVIPYQYDDVFMGFNNGLSDVTVNDSCGYINKNGKITIPLKYIQAYPFMSEYAQVMTFDYKGILIDKLGNEYEYSEVDKSYRLWRPRNSYPGSIKTLTGKGRVNEKGDTIVPPIYKVTGNFSDHMYIVQDKNNKWGAYNDKGQLTVLPQYDNIWHFYEGVANFKLKDKWGYVNKKGETVIKPSFDYAAQFYDGMAYVELNGKAGFINRKGQIVISIIYEPFKMTRFE